MRFWRTTYEKKPCKWSIQPLDTTSGEQVFNPEIVKNHTIIGIDVPLDKSTREEILSTLSTAMGAIAPHIWLEADEEKTNG